MPGPYTIELRRQIVSHVEGGATHRATAAKYDVSTDIWANSTAKCDPLPKLKPLPS